MNIDITAENCAEIGEWKPVQDGKSQCWTHFQKHATEQKCNCIHCDSVLSTLGFVPTTLRRHMNHEDVQKVFPK